MKTMSLIAGVALGRSGSLVHAGAEPPHDAPLTTADGRTLYTSDGDASRGSACEGACNAVLRPFIAGDAAHADGRFAIVVRGDRSRQWAVDGRPLCVYTGDALPGDANGDGFGGAWHVAQPPSKRMAAAPGYTIETFGRALK